MGRGMIFELADRDMSIALDGRELGVSQHSLDEADLGAILEHQGGHGVAEEVTGPDFAESRQVLS